MKDPADRTGFERLRIDTPENVAFDYQVAGIGSRFLAALIDSIVIAVLQAVTFCTLNAFLLDLLAESNVLSAWVIALFGLISFGLFWGYYVFFEVRWAGGSPGKRRVGLRVIRNDGTPISLTESIIRNLIRLVDFMPLYYAIGVVTMFIDPQSRRLGDLAASTLVVYDQEVVTLESLEAAQALPRASRPRVVVKGDWPIEHLTDQDLQLAENFLSRRGEFANPAPVAERISQVLLERMGIPAEQVGLMSGEDVIIKVIQDSRRRET